MTDNVIMKNYSEEPIGKGWMVNDSAALKYARELKKAFDIIVPNVGTSVRLLSGGNLQKVILAREISKQPEMLIAMQPRAV